VINDPIATSTTIARTYGFAPALAAPLALPAVYLPANEHPGAVTRVTGLTPLTRTHAYTGSLFDEYA